MKLSADSLRVRESAEPNVMNVAQSTIDELIADGNAAELTEHLHRIEWQLDDGIDDDGGVLESLAAYIRLSLLDMGQL